MIVSQITVSAVGPNTVDLHTVVIANLEAVALSFDVEIVLNQTGYVWTDGNAVRSALSSGLSLQTEGAPPVSAWKRQGDLYRLGARLTAAAGHSGAMMLRQVKVALQVGLTGFAGTVAVKLPVVVGGTTAAPKAAAQLDHPARALVSVFRRVHYLPDLVGPTLYWPAHLAHPMPPVGGSCEFFIPPDQPATPVVNRRRAAAKASR